MAVGASVLAESLSSPAGFWQQQTMETTERRKSWEKYLIITKTISMKAYLRG